jgi:DNA-binding CsgD family transcriptional regulator
VDERRALERGRDAYTSRAWNDAYESLAQADHAEPLSAEDLELLARSAYMLGRDDDYVSGLERAHRAYLDSGKPLQAVRCAFWIGHNMMFRGETGPALGWFGRGQRLLERERRDCVERGYLLIPVVLEHSSKSDFENAYATADEIAEIGERFGDQDLVAIGLMEQGRALVKQGRTEDGLRLVDETMVAVTAGELSPIVAGIVYCNTISFCRSVYELRRAREWTDALTRWCDLQPEMVAHRGLCLVHRAQIMALGGAWRNALEELGRLTEDFTGGVLNQLAVGHAAYEEGEVRRLQGELSAAEAAYRKASRAGREPHPGLALLRLAQGKSDAASAAIRRAVSETTQRLKRTELLPAYVEIMLSASQVEEARRASAELEETAERQQSEMLRAMSALAQGAVALAEGNAQSALVALRRAWRGWQELEVPYEAARSRVLVGLACAELGDADAAALELEGAREIFAQLGATPEVARVDTLTRPTSRRVGHGLSSRELQVLRLVASGKSNREIASALVISERTVARHVQNIFAKLRVSSRTAASVFAVEHDLL